MIVDCWVKKNDLYHTSLIKMALLLKPLLNYYLRIFGSFMAFPYHLLQIETLSLF